jgi:tetratricopeptide (TPR) repeat protein
MSHAGPRRPAHRQIHWRTTFTVIAGMVLGACSTLPSDVRNYGTLTQAIELGDTPFIPQERYQCGPAALLTVLSVSNATPPLDEVVERVYLPGSQGSLQAEITATVRAYGRVPYVIDAGMSAIASEIQAGRPVMVLQNLGVSWLPRWHYAVVVGIDPLADQVVLRSGTDARRKTPTNTFLRTWGRSDYWGLVVLRPGEMPAIPEPQRYLQAIAGLEATGRYDALTGYGAALRRWPDNTVALYGAATANYQLRQFAPAIEYYQEILVAQPAHLSARNNLAYALFESGDYEDALQTIQEVIARADEDDPLRGLYLASRDELCARVSVIDPPVDAAKVHCAE